MQRDAGWEDETADHAQVHMRARGDAEDECVCTDEVAPKLDVGSLTAVVGLSRPRIFAGSDAEEVAAGRPAEKLPPRGRRRRSAGGGGAPPLDLAESSKATQDGEFSPMSVGRARFRREFGLTWAGNPHAMGFQRCMLDSAWAGNTGKRGGSPLGIGLPN